ncbi:MAG TPA: Ig-like domain-containing protein, partial [Acidimicrobiales bacterium]|nr:Ig-like domain-containing protein [Acidimicrobiales bacterium]
MRCAIVAASLLAAVVLPVAPADAAPALTIRPITWNVLGIDSNNPATSGPDTFPVAARICNTGDSTATNVTSSFVFDSANSFINVSGLSGLSLGDLAAGACVDAVYNVVVARNTAAFDTSRLYRISAAATGMSPISTPSNRELYVERLISQNRNAVLGITGSAIDVAPSTSAPGHATVVVGQTYDFTVTSQTAPGGYEQLESFLNFPNTIFQVMAVNASYPTPTGATNDTVYADACGWDNNIGPRPPRGTYLSCAGPANYPGGKAGGGPIVTTYTVKVVATGTGTLSTLIYDFSGSSFHYNTDFGANLNAVVFETVNPPDLSITKSHVGRFRAGATGSYAISVTNVGGAPTRATTTVVDSLPPELSFQSAAGTGWTCSASGQTVTCDYPTALAAGESSTIDLTVAVDPDAPTTVTNTATVATAGDSNTANNATSDPTTIDAQPAAVSDSASTPEDTATTVDVLANDSGLRDTPVTVSSTDPPNGTVSCSPTSCTYTPDADFSGTDSFSYTVSDADGDSASATVTITVTPVNDPPAYTAAP